MASIFSSIWFCISFLFLSFEVSIISVIVIPFQTAAVQATQCFEFSLNQSVAGDDYAYLPTGSNGTLADATHGELIDFKCASVICPNPPVQDCFNDPTVCEPGTWCFLSQQELWGPWAMGTGGETPGASGHAGIQCADAEAAGMTWWWDTVCNRNSSWGPFTSNRGRCVPFRKEEESCQAELREGNSLYGPEYAVKESGRPFTRPLRCGPGLICTGDVEPTPYTCVKARPPNVCYQGPWWNSTWCKVGGGAGGEYPTGLPQDVLEEAAAALILQFAQDNLKPNQPEFWTSEMTNRTRAEASNIVETLWPPQYRATTTFPLSTIPDPYASGPVYSAAWNSTASEASTIMAQTPKVWSTVHSLIHNTNDPMSNKQVWASRALALFLVQNFQCGDCRGFFHTDIIEVIGIPPDSSVRQNHQRWWWRAHNMVSEHTAATRGGHPWIYLAMTDAKFSEVVGKNWGNNSEVLNCQNPFFLAYEDAVAMWSIE